MPDVPQTFLSQVKKAREENIGCCNFCMAFFALLLGSSMYSYRVPFLLLFMPYNSSKLLFIIIIPTKGSEINSVFTRLGTFFATVS